MPGPDSTLLEALQRRAKDTPDQPAFWFDGEPYGCRRLWQESGAAAAAMGRRGLRPGDKLLLALPNGPDFFRAFYGAQRAGAVAVPVYPNSGAARLRHLADHSRAGLAVLPAAAAEPYQRAGQDGLDVLTPADLAAGAGRAEFPQLAPEDAAYVQYTSGSTGEPKGVVLSHSNVLTNARQMIAGMEISPQEIFVSWLPVHHDMGLILKTIVPLIIGAQTHLLPASLRELRSWLATIDRVNGTFTAAPDFAYRLALRAAGRRSQRDLSSLRVALNASEPVRARTLRSFHDTFGLERTMVAGYGLAEATVGVSMWPPGSENRIDGDGFVSVGRPFPGVQVRIGTAEASKARGEVGGIWLRSPANTRGYLNNQGATASLFDEHGFLDTGDLGYLDRSGNLYVVGRRKNIIKLGGRTIYPKEVEEVVEQLDGVRLAAAVGLDEGGLQGEQLQLFLELRYPGRDDPDSLHELAVAAVAATHEHLGVRPARTYLLQRGAIPRTDTGKIQHSRLRQQHQSGTLAASGAVLYPRY